MAILIALLVALVFFVGFLALTVFEQGRARVLSGARTSLDAEVSRAASVVRSTSFLDLLFRALVKLGAIIAHDITAAALRATRMLERALHATHVRLRRERASAGTSAFAKLIPHFKRPPKRVASSPIAETTDRVE